MNLVKIKESFFQECQRKGTDSELMYNENGRPNVLIVRLKYKGAFRKFVVPLRSNISGRAPSWQYFSLPPNQNTAMGNHHGIHYIKIFPISDRYVDNYLINTPFDLMVKGIIDAHEAEIVNACQNYLNQCENGNKHFMTPDIDGILQWL